MLHAHDVLLDLHSFQAAGGQPFVMVGPQDNDDALEPFAHAQAERAWAQQLGVRRAVDGWLSTYAAGVARRAQDLEAAKLPTAHLNLSAIYGVGTTEYMRRHGAQDKGTKGGLALTLECGQHADPQAPQVAYDAILNTLAHFGMLQGAAAPAAQHMEGLRMYEVIDKAHEADTFARAWASFDALRAGDLIGTRASGAVVKAPHDGYILFPNALAQPGQEWFYLAKASTRFAQI
jgi:predicted deacylase